MPTVWGPDSSTSTANTTPRTIVAPATTVWAHTRMAIIIRFRSRQMKVKPPPISRRRPALSSFSPSPSCPSPWDVPSSAGRMPWMPDTRTAETTNVTTLTIRTVWMFVTLMRSAPSAGPTKKARLSMVLEAPLAAVSSSGVLARDGIQAIWAGRNTQPMRELSVASARIDSVGAPTAMSAAAMLTRTERVRSEPMSTALRGSRSASVDPMGAAKAMSSSRTAPQTPTS